MPEQIGLQAVLEMSNFNDGVKVYLTATAKMDKATEETTKVTQNLFQTIASDIARGAFERIGQMFTNFAAQLPQMAVEIYNLGAQAEAAQYRFEAFAGGPEAASQYLTAFTNAADGAIDRMSAMQGAAKLLQMGLVSNADEMELMASIAVKLGDQTAAAGDRVNDFSLLLANQSVMRLDNFGISSGRVRKRIEELQKATKDMSREEAFKIAVMEEGKKSLDILGDSTGLTVNQMAKLKAAVMDAKVGLGELAIEATNSSGAMNGLVDSVATHIREIPNMMRVYNEFGKIQLQVEAGTLDWKTAIDKAVLIADSFVSKLEGVESHQEKLAKQTEETSTEINRYKNALSDANPELKKYANILPDVSDEVDNIATKMPPLTFETRKYLEELALSEPDLDNFTGGAVGVAKAIEEADKAARDAAETMQTKLMKTMTDMSITFTDFGRDLAESRKEYTESIEDIELEHQENLAKLTKKGQAWRKQIDLEAENEKLATLQQKLDLALLQQSEFTDKTKESTRVAKQQQIAALQAQIAEEAALIESANNGYIVMQGANVTEDLALENTRYAEKLRLAQEAYALEQEEQRRHLGQMILNSFDAWVSINGGVSKETETMRAKLAEEYGLMESGSSEFVGSMWTMFDEWGKDMGGSTEALVTGLNNAANAAYGLGTAIENLPTQKTINVDYRVTGPAPDAESHPEYVPHTGGSGDYGGATPGYASGGTSYGGSAVVGERGPELINLPRGASVMSATDTSRLLKSVSTMMQSNSPVSQVMNNQKSVNVPINAVINNGMDQFAFQASVEQAIANAL